MTNNNDSPLTYEEYSKLLIILSQISDNIERLLTHGVIMDESLSDERIKASKSKIDSNRRRIQKEQERIRKLKDYLKRKKEMNRCQKH